jgi:hypothetical protein
MADEVWITEAVYVDDEGRFLRDVPSDKPEWRVPVCPALSIDAPVDSRREFRYRVYRRRLLRSRGRMTDEEIAAAAGGDLVELCPSGIVRAGIVPGPSPLLGHLGERGLGPLPPGVIEEILGRLEDAFFEHVYAAQPRETCTNVQARATPTLTLADIERTLGEFRPLSAPPRWPAVSAMLASHESNRLRDRARYFEEYKAWRSARQLDPTPEARERFRRLVAACHAACSAVTTSQLPEWRHG